MNYILGKINPDKPLIEHLIDTGCVAISLLNEMTFRSVYYFLYKNCNYTGKTPDNFKKWIAFMISLHDIGKLDFKFQTFLNEENAKNNISAVIKDELSKDMFENQNFRHEIYSQEILKRLYPKLTYINEWSCCIRMHHQHIKAKHFPEIEKYYKDYNLIQQKFQIDLSKKLEEIFSTNPDLIVPEFTNKTIWWNLFTGLMILSDWIASDSKYLVNNTSNYFEESLKIAQKIINNIGLTSGYEIPNFKSFEECFGFKRETMRGIQLLADEKIPYDSKLVIIEAATGEGKTEAALYLVFKMCYHYDKSGIYVALPTAATSNQMYDRVKETFHNNGNIKLMHSNSWLLDNNSHFEINLLDAANWFSSTRRGLLCQNAVGTIDQIMQSVMKIKYSMLKFLGLENKVVIIDELHAYDSYMKTIIKNLLNWLNCANIPVILLSATLPDNIKKEYISIYSKEEFTPQNSYPLITCIDQNNEIKEYTCESYKNETIKINIKNILGNYDEYAYEIVKKTNQIGFVSCICNTVEAAQKTYLKVKEKADSDTQVFLLHSKFTMEDREKIENKIIDIFSKKGIAARPTKCIVVATQVIEQSLDIDFDYEFTEIAPIDLLLQRIGRVKRFDNLVNRSPEFNKKEKEITIFSSNNNDYGKISYVYYDLLLNRTNEYIKNNSIIKVPEDMRDCINSIYKNSMDKMFFQQWSEMYSNENLKNLYAGGVCLPSPNKDYLFYLDSEQNPIDAFCAGNDDNLPITRIGTGNERIVFVNSINEIEEAEINFEKAKNLYKQSLSVNINGEIEQTMYIGKKYIKNLTCIVSNSKEINIGKKHFIYNSELGLINKNLFF